MLAIVLAAILLAMLLAVLLAWLQTVRVLVLAEQMGLNFTRQKTAESDK